MPENVLDIQWIGIAGVVILLVLVYFFWKKRPNALQMRKRVKVILESLGDDYTLYQNIVIPAQGGMSHINYVLASSYGIFIIDFRKEVGTIIGNANDREWLVEKRDTIYNPLWRNRTHMNGLESYLGVLPMESLVVFPCAKFTGEFGSGVIVLKKMKAFIKDHTKVRISSQQLQFVKDRLGSLQKKE